MSLHETQQVIAGTFTAAWLFGRPTLLPPSAIPDQSIVTAPASSAPSPFPRYGHATSNLAAQGRVYVFGGRTTSGSYLNDLWLYSTKDNTATLFHAYGDVPSPRSVSSISVAGDVLALWGGYTSNGCEDDALYWLDLISHKWTKVLVQGRTPAGRCQHAFATVGSLFFVFGGYNSREKAFMNDMWSLDINTLRTRPIWKLIKPSSKNHPPPRLGHRLVLYQDQLITFGGWDGSKYYNDVWSFNLETLIWTKLQYTGQPPSGRESYAAAVVDDMVYIFGGGNSRDGGLSDLAIFRISTLEWLRPQPALPSGRRYHSMVAVDSSVYVLGGTCNGGLRPNDLDLIFVLYTGPITDQEQATDKTFSVSISLPSGRETGLHCKFLLESVFENHETEVEDVWTFSFCTDKPIPGFRSQGVNEERPKRTLRGTYRSMDQLNGFDCFKGNIGNGRIYIRTDRGVVIKGEIVGGPRSGQRFSGSGTWTQA